MILRMLPCFEFGEGGQGSQIEYILFFVTVNSKADRFQRNITIKSYFLYLNIKFSHLLLEELWSIIKENQSFEIDWE